MSAPVRYGSRMRNRWLVVFGIATAVFFADQISKFLAVKHLTPGIADAALSDRRIATREEQAAVLEDTGLGTELGLFFSDVRNPCQFNRRLCPEVKVVDGFWSWHYAENKGAAWSMFAKMPDGLRLPLLIGVSGLAVFFILGFVRKLEPGQNLLLVALSLVLGGALGNLLDRAYLGYVIDFIVWYRGTFVWPTFNVADAGISVGVGLIVLTSILDFFRARGREGVETSVAQP